MSHARGAAPPYSGSIRETAALWSYWGLGNPFPRCDKCGQLRGAAAMEVGVCRCDDYTSTIARQRNYNR